MPSTMNCSFDLSRLRAELDAADAVLLGAGAGLSTSAGFTYAGERFRKHFADFGAKYGFQDMYSGGFFPYPMREEFWAYWSRYIWINRYTDAPRPVYQKLLELVQSKDYFVLTTNVDHCFQKAGFDKKRLFYTQGDYGLFQCLEPCRQETFDNEQVVRAMLDEQRDMKIPPSLMPVCPHCGKPMTMNLRSDDKFAEDAGWHEAAARYDAFVRGHGEGRVLYLELGVGYNTPGVIKLPFWRMTYANPSARLISVNAENLDVPQEIASRSVCVRSDVGDLLGV